MSAIFVVGPDGCGKTHIAHALSKQLQLPYFKVSTEKSNWGKVEAFKDSIAFDMLLPQFCRQTGTSFVSDRGYPCEDVYSRVFKRATYGGTLQQIDKEWAEMGAIILCCLRRDYSDVEDDLVATMVLPRLHEKYVEFCKGTKCSAIQIYVDDYDNDINKQIPAIAQQVWKLWKSGTKGKIEL